MTSQGQIKVKGDPGELIQQIYPVTAVVSSAGSPSYETAVVVTVNFPAPAQASASTMAATDSLVPIVLGAAAAVLLILVVILSVYICRR